MCGGEFHDLVTYAVRDEDMGTARMRDDPSWFKCRTGDGAAYDGSAERWVNAVKRALLISALTALVALAIAGVASATPVVPAVPVSSYGDSLLSSLGTAVGQVFPYAAAVTAFAIGVGLVKRWLGSKKATKV